MSNASQIQLTPKALRIAAGFDSLAELVAQADGLSESTAARIERGFAGVSVRKLEAYARACRVPFVTVATAFEVQTKRSNQV